MTNITPFTPEEELLLHSVIAISGINFDEYDHKPKEITDQYSAWALYRIGNRYQIYSCQTEESWGRRRTVLIMRLCDFYFSMEYVCTNGPVKIRLMKDLDFEALIEKEKEILSRMDTEE